jgi:3-oxoadipate enol-lactonase
MALHHQLTGPEDAPVVVFGSALGTTHALWEAQVAAFSERFRVLAFDHRGHGKSDVPPGPYSMDDLGGDVVGLLDSLGIEQASYVGISLGGAVGVWLAENAPERFHRFALLCPPAYPVAGPQVWLDRAAQVRSEGTESVADATINRWFLPEWAAEHPDVVASIRQQLVDTPDEGYAACCEALSATDLRDGLGSITAPVLMVAAQSDSSVPAEVVLPVAKAIDGARFEVIENAAHLIVVSHAEQVNHLLLDHLAG